MGDIRRPKTLLLENPRYSANCPYKIRQIQRNNLPKKDLQILLHVRQIGFRQIVFRQIVPNPLSGLFKLASISTTRNVPLQRSH